MERDYAALANVIHAMPSRDAAKSYIRREKLSGSELKRVAKAAGIVLRSGPLAAIEDQLVECLTGARLKHDALLNVSLR